MPDSISSHPDPLAALADHKLIEKASRLAAAFADAKAEAARAFNLRRQQIEAEYASPEAAESPDARGQPAPPE